MKRLRNNRVRLAAFLLFSIFSLSLGLVSYSFLAADRAYANPPIDPLTGLPVVTPPTNGGSKTAAWEDHSTLYITISGEKVKFFDNKIDGNLSYDSTADAQGGCDKSKVNDFKPGDGGNIPNSAMLHVYAPASSTNTNCKETTYKISFKDNQNFNKYFIWLDESTIETSDGTAMTFVAGSDKKMFIDNGDGRSSDTKCKSYIKADPDNPNNGTLFLSNQENENTFDTGFTSNISGLDTGDFTLKDGCYVSKGLSIKLGHLADAKKAAGSGTTSTNGNDSGSTELSCNAGLNPLNWLICGIIKGLVGVLNGVDSIINSLLAIGTNGKVSGSPDEIFDLQSGKNAANYYEAWSSFRNIALGVIVVVALAAIISQMAGFEFIDAYTIRKVLPRILAMSIIITLSWPILQFFVQLSNDLGFGVRALIEYPFRSSDNTIALSGGQGVAVYLATGAAVLALGVFGLLSFVGTAVLAAFVAFLVLVIRQIVVILLVIVAPIAFACYILPNTQRFYKIWFDSFSGALLMFPIIAAMIATGRVFATVAIQDDSPVGSFIAFAAYFAPYFLIPYAFKMSGGAMSAISGAIQSRAQGGFGALKQYRANKTKENLSNHAEKFRTGAYKTIVPEKFNRLNNYNQAAIDKLNRFGQNSTAGLKGGFGFGERGVKHRELMDKRAMENAAKEEALKGHGASNAGNRLQLFLAETGGDNVEAEKRLREWYGTKQNEYNKVFTGNDLESKVREAKAVVANRGGHSQANAAAALMEMAADGTAIRDIEDAANLSAWAAGGNESLTYEYLSQVGSTGKKVGRGDLSAAQVHKQNLAAATAAKFKGKELANHKEIVDAAVSSASGGQTAIEAMQYSPSRVIRSRTEHSMDIVQRYMEDPSSVDYNLAVKEAATLAQMQNAADMGYTTVDNKIEFEEAMGVTGRREDLEKFLKTSQAEHEKKIVSTVADDYGVQQTVRAGAHRDAPLPNDYGETPVDMSPGVEAVRRIVPNARSKEETDRARRMQREDEQYRASLTPEQRARLGTAGGSGSGQYDDHIREQMERQRRMDDQG